MKHRLDYLDSARGIAAILVLIFHSVLIFGKGDSLITELNTIFRETFDLGKIAVIIFFILSGVVIPFSFSGAKKDGTKKFIISRFFRLYPVYWLSVILGFLIFGGFTFKEFIINFTMLQQFIGVKNIIGLYWTLQIELVFYFLALLVFLWRDLKDVKFLYSVSIGFLILACIMSIIRGQLEMKLPLALPLALSLMFFGSFYRYQLFGGNSLAKKLFVRYLVCFIILIPIIAKSGYDIDFGYDESWSKYLITYYSGLFLFLGIVYLKYSNPVIEYLGRISYSVYLFHPIFIYIIETSSIFKGFSSWVNIILVLIFTIVFSHFTFSFIEKPCISLGRVIKNKALNVSS